MKKIQRRPLALCTCQGAVCGPGRGQRFLCRDCRRFVPWCFGAADDRPMVCDNCYAKKEAA